MEVKIAENYTMPLPFQVGWNFLETYFFPSSTPPQSKKHQLSLHCIICS
jgi:hypothetical protein